MLLTLIFGFMAGYAVPLVEPSVRQAMRNVTLSQIEVADGEYDVLTLLLLMLAAAGLAAILGAEGGGVALVLGALSGVFGKRALDAAMGSKGDKA
jgi:hypothetical protein